MYGAKNVALFSSPLNVEIQDSRTFSEKRRKEKYESSMWMEKNQVSIKIFSDTNLSFCAIDRFESFTSLRKPRCKIRSPERIRAYRLHPNCVTAHKSAFEEQERYGRVRFAKCRLL